MLNRRDAMKVGISGAAAAGLSVAGVAVARSSAVPAAAVPAAADDHIETYKGRNIRVTGTDGEPEVYIDGRQLFLMKLGDRAYLSAMCHYAPEPTPLHAARTAVDELRGADLLPLGDHRPMQM